MEHSLVQEIALHFILLLFLIAWNNYLQTSCILVDLERPATVSITGQQSSDDGEAIWGYVQVRKGTHLFWSYYKSPHRVSSPGKQQPWPTIFYAAPATSSGHGSFNGIGALQPRNSTWLHNADLLIVDNPVGTGYSYEEDAESGKRLRWSFMTTSVSLQAAEDIIVLLRALTKEIATLQNSSLFSLHSRYGGTYADEISYVVGQAILTGALNNLTFGGMLERFDGRGTPQQHNRILVTRPRIRVVHPAFEIRRSELNCTCSQLSRTDLADQIRSMFNCTCRGIQRRCLLCT